MTGSDEAGGTGSDRREETDALPGVSGVGSGESPRVAFLRALRVTRNAKVGVAVGVALASLAYVVRVAELLGPFRGTQRYPVIGEEGWFLVLAFVLATSTALLVTMALTTVRAVRLAREVGVERD